MTKNTLFLLLAVPALILTAGCSTHRHHHHEVEPEAMVAPSTGMVSPWSAVNQLVAVINPTAGSKVSGVIRFTQVGPLVKVVADVEGLTPNGFHAFHIHEFGDVTSADGSSAGGHYNPEGHQHGLTSSSSRHAGDLGNLQADAQGKAHYEISVDNISLVGQRNPILGRGVVVHAKIDDGGQPVGNAGARIGYGVIGVTKPTN